jgi:uncharacterized protein with GYD domain
MRHCAPLRADAGPAGQMAPGACADPGDRHGQATGDTGGGARRPGCRVPVQGACEILVGVARGPTAGSTKPGRREFSVPSDLIQLAYTPDAWAAMVKQPQNRLEAARPVVEQLGGKFEHAWLAFGEYDIVGVVEMPENTDAAAFAMAIAAGAAKAFKTTPPLSVEEGVEAMRKAQGTGVPPARRISGPGNRPLSQPGHGYNTHAVQLRGLSERPVALKIAGARGCHPDNAGSHVQCLHAFQRGHQGGHRLSRRTG